MRFIKRSQRRQPELSLVLLDWSVRESFHVLSYLEKQTVERDFFEVLVIEYYSRVSEALQVHERQVDTWLLLEMPESCHYHKHLMYNVGIALSNGEIIAIGDSDAMVRETLVETILRQFASEPRSVFHIDQFRNARSDLYPFAYPSFDEVLGAGCINNVGGRTAGIALNEDALHTRNYGSCMSARREDLIAVGGADLHPDYLGHICGPYDMTFRLTNLGLRERWSRDEFTYHTWHPGQAGADNHMGPHDGRHMSTTSLESLRSGRVRPLVEHPAIAMLRERGGRCDSDIIAALIDPLWPAQWSAEAVDHAPLQADPPPRLLGPYRGYFLEQRGHETLAFRSPRTLAESPAVRAPSEVGARAAIDADLPRWLKLQSTALIPFALGLRLWSTARRRLPRPRRATASAGSTLAAPAREGRPHWLDGPRTLFSALRDALAAARDDAHRLTDLVAGLYQMYRDRPSTDPTVVFVERRSSEAFLRLVIVAGLLPPSARAVRVREFEDFAASWPANDAPRVAIQAELAERFHADRSASGSPMPCVHL